MQNSSTFNHCCLKSNATHHVYRHDFSPYAQSVSSNKLVYPAHSADIDQLSIFASYQPQTFEIPKYEPKLRSKQYVFCQLLVDKSSNVPQEPATEEDRLIAQKLIDQSNHHVSTSLFLQDQIHQSQINRVSPNQKSMSPRSIQIQPLVDSHQRLKSSSFLQNLNRNKYQSSSKNPKMGQYSASSHQRSTKSVQKSPLFEKFQRDHPKVLQQTQPNNSSDSVLFKGTDSAIDASFEQHIKKLSSQHQKANNNVAKIIYLDDEKPAVLDETENEIESQREAQVIRMLSKQIPTQDDIKERFFSAPVSLEEVAFSPLSKITTGPRKQDMSIKSKREKGKIAKLSANTSHELLNPQAIKQQNDQSVVSQNELGLAAQHASQHLQEDEAQNQKSEKDQQILQQQALINCKNISPQTQDEQEDDVSKYPEIKINDTSDEDKQVQEELSLNVSQAQNLNVQNENIYDGDLEEKLQDCPEQLPENIVEILDSNNAPVDCVQDEIISKQQCIVESTNNDKENNAVEQQAPQPEIALNSQSDKIEGISLLNQEKVEQQYTVYGDQKNQCEQNETTKDIENAVKSEYNKD